ncbi:MAG: RNA polymerase sigma factor [Deltaproteobacteria bacterium]|nr:RNA polymerase sigma factor [Deltaproteobacteria bacterium]
MELATIEQAARGDVAAFRNLVVQSRGVVYAICLSHVGQGAEAEDLSQEVFVQVHRDLKDLREPERFLPWLRQVATNVCLMAVRRRRLPMEPLDAGADHPDPAAAGRLRRMELCDIAWRALAGVSAASREVLALRYLAGCSEAEIGDALGLPLAKVKSRLHEGRKQAQRELRPIVRELLRAEAGSDEAVDEIMAKCGSPGCRCSHTLTEGR